MSKSLRQSIEICFSRPIHEDCIPSLLSQDSPEQNYRGFLNLVISLTCIYSIRMVCHSVKTFGFSSTFLISDVSLENWCYAALLYASLVGQFVIALFLQKWLAASSRPLFFRVLKVALVAVNISGAFLLSMYVVWQHIRHYVLGQLSLLLSVVCGMKLISYHLTNYGLSELEGTQQKDQARSLYLSCPYPKNLSIGNIFYFFLAPTLCYQPVYPRNRSIRVGFLAKRLLELVSGCFMLTVVIAKFTIPAVQESLKHFLTGNYWVILDKGIIIATYSLFGFLLFFWTLFQSFPNVIAELLRFGDRRFYQAWWNANSMEEYWRMWNTPVHCWFKRHIYLPLRASSLQLSAGTCQFLVFCISALMHEYLVAVPTHIIRGWAFMSIFLQIPLISFTGWILRKFPASSFGNYFFWLSFCLIGQPMGMCLYYRASISRPSPDHVVIGLL